MTKEVHNLKYDNDFEKDTAFKRNAMTMIENFEWHVKKFFSNGANKISNILIIVTPFLMLAIGEYVYSTRGEFLIGGEIIICIFLVVFTLCLKAYSNVSKNSGKNIPVPYERFTNVDCENGKVDVEQKRIQEMILYMADLEDWFDRNGYHD